VVVTPMRVGLHGLVLQVHHHSVVAPLPQQQAGVGVRGQRVGQRGAAAKLSSDAAVVGGGDVARVGRRVQLVAAGRLGRGGPLGGGLVAGGHGIDNEAGALAVVGLDGSVAVHVRAASLR
jgi:hypothetical protein